jgi:hypothetical protein
LDENEEFNEQSDEIRFLKASGCREKAVLF